MKNKKMNIAIVGLGNIGSFLYQYLEANKTQIKKKTNVEANVICVSAKNYKKRRKISFKKSKWVKNYLDIVKRKDVDIIVELIGGSEGAAKKLVFEALKNKKHVVTANKALISKYGNQLSRIAETNKVNLEFEAAVCGGVPIIRNLKESLIANSISKIYGIFNGTSNYILTLMDLEKITFESALNKAKKLGYAESNPISDLNGEDVSSKLQILTALSFNSFISSKKINIEGIKDIDQTDIVNANKLGYKIKLLGASEIVNNKVVQRVHPSFIKNDTYIASVSGVLNAVIVNSKPVGQSVVQGEGAGPEPTTSALISDISSILRGNIKYPFALSDKERKNIMYDDINNMHFSAYVRLDVVDKHGVLANITEFFAKNHISIKRLIQNPLISKKYSSIIIITHSTKDSNLTNTIKQLKKKSYIIKKPKFIRIEE